MITGIFLILFFLNMANTGRTRFTTNRKEPCNAHLSMRIPQSLLDRLKSQDDWREYLRNLLDENLQEIEQDKSSAKV